MALPPAAVYTVIGALAAAENVFPPVPADTAVALGAFLSAGGRISATAVFLITWVANVATATSVYLAGRTVGRSFFRGRLGRRLMHPRRLARLEDLYRHYGSWGIFFSRFIPGVRGVVPPFAGIAHLTFWRAVPPMALASGIWYGALTFAAATVVTQLDDLVRFVGHFNRLALLVGLVSVGVITGLVWRRRRARLRASASTRVRPDGAEEEDR
ncbi:MAG: DedA family protein [Gemmatimonadetes bacterium]|nr:DedA family protein [Gemmatimonadota bacterium]MBI2537665.1 DedA family protein [Gemmatimonadota bacterium]